jgi:hypothetical protein
MISAQELLEALPQMVPAANGNGASIYKDLVSRRHVIFELQGENGTSDIEPLHASSQCATTHTRFDDNQPQAEAHDDRVPPHSGID